MKLLCLSDVHNNLASVRRMRAQEKNVYDAILVAGDIGNDSASEFFKILRTFKCPVIYVYGNWDSKLSYRKSYVANGHLIHLSIIKVGRMLFTGFSGCPTNWGKNPLAQKINNRDAKEILALNRQELANLILKRQNPPENTIVITHERLSRIREIAPNLLLHVFGHIHKFAETDFGGTKFVNVSCLDRQISVRPKRLSEWSPGDCRNFNAGNYTTIEIDRHNKIKVRCVPFKQDYPKWTQIKGIRYFGIEWIPEEKKWTRATDPKLPRYDIISDPQLLGPHTIIAE